MMPGFGALHPLILCLLMLLSPKVALSAEPSSRLLAPVLDNNQQQKDWLNRHLSIATGALALVLLIEGPLKPSLYNGQLNCRRHENGFCDQSSLSLFDRWSVTQHSSHWRLTSDIAELGAIFFPVVFWLSTATWQNLRQHQPIKALASYEALLLTVEAVSVATLLSSSIKIFVKRPRPELYRRTFQSIEQTVSFPSGHTTLLAASSSAMTILFWKIYPQSPWRYVILASGIGLTTLTGLGRILGGMHFSSDVLAGLVIGGGVGILLSIDGWHRDLHLQPIFHSTFTGEEMLGLKMTFLMPS